MEGCKADVRVVFYDCSKGPVLNIRFCGDTQKVFKAEYLRVMQKGHRLYFSSSERGSGYKLQSNGLLNIGKLALELRKFEGEYTLMNDGIHYYIDHDQVMPLSTGGYENKHPYPSGTKKKITDETVKNVTSVEERITVEEPTIIPKKEEKPKKDEGFVINVLKEQAIALLLGGRTADAEVLAKAIKILTE